MATNDKCRQSALGDLREEKFKSLAMAGTLYRSKEHFSFTEILHTARWILPMSWLGVTKEGDHLHLKKAV